MKLGWQDLRQAARRLATNPMVALPALLSLALAVGANGAMFGVVKRLLLDPLPYAGSQELVRIWASYPQFGEGRYSMSYPNYADLAGATGLEGLAAYEVRSYTMLADGRPERVGAVTATGSLFGVLGVEPALGRVFGPEEARPGGDRVVVLSHRLWLNRMGGGDVVGRTVSLDGEPYTVAGVMPEGFTFPLESGELWVPLHEDASTWHRARGGLSAVGRLAPDVDVRQLNAQLEVVSARILEDHPQSHEWTAVSATLPDVEYGSDLRLMLYTLLGAVVLLLLIASINISNLLLARSTGRRQEVAVRAALGAGRARVVRLFLLESLLLGAAGGVLGLLVAHAGIGVLRQVAPPGVARSDGLALDPAVMAATLVVALLAGLLFGLLPALNALRTGPAAALRASGRGRTVGTAGRRTQRALVAAQVALVLMVLTAAGLMLRTAGALRAVDPGFDAGSALTGSVLLTSDYERTDQVTAFNDRVLERLRAEPGVEAAGAVFTLPVAGENNTVSIGVEDSRHATGFDNQVAINLATPGYFAALGIPVVDGRAFDATDRHGAMPAVIVSDALARRFWPDEPAVGKRLALSGESRDSAAWRTVVGVVGSTRHTGLRAEPRAEFYLPWTQDQSGLGAITFVVRAADPAARAGTLRDAVAAADPGQAVFAVRTMDEIVATETATTRGLALLLALFGGVALVLAAVGVFGVVSYTVATRRHEMGIRAALGAAHGRILRLVIAQGLAPVAVGIALGLLVASGTTTVLENLLYDVEPLDTLTFATVPVLLLAVALAAVWIPARRAARLEPIEALRLE
ncbi:MAG: ABC transporter permease [Gemmatimonadota bacterium]